MNYVIYVTCIAKFDLQVCSSVISLSKSIGIEYCQKMCLKVLQDRIQKKKKNILQYLHQYLKTIANTIANTTILQY